jgi:hypothetical protein
MTSLDAPAPRLASIDRRQMLLRTVDVERLVDDDHCVRSIWALVESWGQTGRFPISTAIRPAVHFR